MKPSEWLESLRDIDFNDLDTSNIGSWPAAVKAIAGALLMVLVLALGYNFSSVTWKTNSKPSARKKPRSRSSSPARHVFRPTLSCTPNK